MMTHMALQLLLVVMTTLGSSGRSALGGGGGGAAGRLSFSGPAPSAALFTLEVSSSFAGVLKHDYFHNATTLHTGGSAGWLGIVPCSNAASQEWPWPPHNSRISDDGDHCLDCRRDSSHHCLPGDEVQLYTCLGTDNQRWRTQNCSAAGTFVLVSEMSRACLGVTSTGRPGMKRCSCDTDAWYTLAGKEPGTAQLRTVQQSPALCLAGNASSGSESVTIPAGYVQASPAGQGWAGSMWPRDGGAFLRELIMFGDFGTAVVHLQCVLQLLTTNSQGFFALPEHFDWTVPSGTLTAEEGTAALVLNMVMLWQRLCHQRPNTTTLSICEQIVGLLSSPKSPIEFWHTILDDIGQPNHVGLVPGSGEFGGGCCAVPGIDSWLYFNSVQNSAVANGLRAAAVFESARGNVHAARRHTDTAALLRKNVERLLTNETDGGWIWAINITTLQPDALLLSNPANIGFAGINELLVGLNDGPAAEWVASPALSSWPAGVDRANRTFYRLLNTPLRKQLWDQYGIYTQFDVLKQANGLPGHGSSAYGHDYALQVLLMQDELGMAARALSLLANITFGAGQRYSQYNFFEQISVPRTPNQAKVGCGELNLVNAMAPIKIARLILGLDDTDPQSTILRPRLPPGWDRLVATYWPVHVADTKYPTGRNVHRNVHRVVRVNITVTAGLEGGASDVTLSVYGGRVLPRLCVRLGSAAQGFRWRNFTNSSKTDDESSSLAQRLVVHPQHRKEQRVTTESDASWCPSLHTIQGNDPSGPILLGDTWHLFVTCTATGNWEHYRSTDLMRWVVVKPTGFDPVTGSVGTTGVNSSLIAFWGNTSKPFPCCDIQASTPVVRTDPNLTAWRPLGLAIPRPTTLSLHQGFRDPSRPLKLAGQWRIAVGSGSGADNTKPLEGRIHWFTAVNNKLTKWRDDGIFLAVPKTAGYVDPTTMSFNSSWNRSLDQIECPDVFELGGKVVVLASLQFDGPWQGTSTSFFVGSVDKTGSRFRLESQGLADYGQFYAGRTGTTIAAAPGDRRVLFGFTGYPSPTLPPICSSLPRAYHGMYHVFPRELGIKNNELTISPVKELTTLHKVRQAHNVTISPDSVPVATGAQLDVSVSCQWMTAQLKGNNKQRLPPTEGQLSLAILEDASGKESLLVGYDFYKEELFVDHSRIGNATIRQTAPLKQRRVSSSQLLRIILDNAMVETICSSAVAITSFVSPSARTLPTERKLRVISVPGSAHCTLSASTLSLQ